MPLSGVVFDFDGVIADTERLHLQAYQQVLAPRSMSLDPRTYYDRYLGFDDVGVFKALAAYAGLELDQRELARLLDEKGRRFGALLEGEAVLYADAPDCIRDLSSMVPLGIASGALRDEIDRILSAAHLRQHFQVVVGADDVAKSKPAPDTYRRAVVLLSPDAAVRSGRSFVAIEDSQWGLESAHAAGLKTIGITNTYPASKLTGADVIVDSLSAIDRPLLDRLCE